MTSAFLIGLPILAFSGALMFLLPQFAPRRFFFAITVPAGFQSGAEARAIERRYHRNVAIALVVSAAVMALLARTMPDAAVIAAVLLPMAGGFGFFLFERGNVRPFAVTEAEVREVELTVEGDQVPRWSLWALPPFLFPAATALYLHQHWNEIPVRFPVHWDLQGEVNGWSTRTPEGVYGVLAVPAFTLIFILLIAVGVFYGARRGTQRMAVLKMLIATMYFVSMIFSWVGLLPLFHISTVWIIVLTSAFTLAILVWSFRMLRQSGTATEVTPDTCWHLGAIYYNHSDPAIFVQKRMGFGYTMNFGNPTTWLLLGGMLAGFVGLVMVAR